MATLIIIAVVLIILLKLNQNIYGIYLLNYLLGIVLITILNDIKYSEVYLGQGGGVLVLLFDVLYFSILYICSFSYLFLDLKNQKMYYFIIPFLIYLLILGYIFSIKKYYLGGSLFIAFFPSHIYSYFKLKKMGKL